MKKIDDIYNLIKIKQDAIEENNVDKYMSTVTENDKLFYSEQKYWISDMIKDEIKDVSFIVKNIKEIDEGYLVLINQKHLLGDEKLDFQYELLLKEDEGELKDYGINFKVIDEGEFRIKYINDDELPSIFTKLIKGVLEDLNTLFGEKLDYVVDFKLYPELDLVRQRSGPAYKWQYPMWAKTNQGIKLYPYYEKPKVYAGWFQHELIHAITLKGNKNHLMQWMSEGIAMKYGNARYDTRDLDFSLKYIDSQNLSVPLNELMDINLPDYTDMNDITKYYNTCFSYFDYLDTISDSKTIRSLFSYIISKNAPADKKGQILLANEAFQEILGLSLENLGRRYLNWYSSK
jgi:uncharacterized protein YlbG (UPF0298 family)